MPSEDGYGFVPAELLNTFTVEMPSTEKPIMLGVAPPTAMLPWLSCWTLGEVASDDNGLVVTARKFNGSSTICDVTFASPIVPFSVFTCSDAVLTSTVSDWLSNANV